MTRIKSTLCAAMALTFAAGTAVPVTAAPVFVPKAPTANENIIKAQVSLKERRERRADRRRDNRAERSGERRGDRREARREERRERRAERRDDRRERRAERRQDRRVARWVRRNGIPYYYGHRGYRYERPGYRYFDGWWFPLAAFALITGAIDNDRSYGSAHVAWCYDRYRSYREWDNTFQPYNGPRKQCYSPYS